MISGGILPSREDQGGSNTPSPLTVYAYSHNKAQKMPTAKYQYISPFVLTFLEDKSVVAACGVTGKFSSNRNCSVFNGTRNDENDLERDVYTLLRGVP